MNTINIGVPGQRSREHSSVPAETKHTFANLLVVISVKQQLRQSHVQVVASQIPNKMLVSSLPSFATNSPSGSNPAVCVLANERNSSRGISKQAFTPGQD